VQIAAVATQRPHGPDGRKEVACEVAAGRNSDIWIQPKKAYVALDPCAEGHPFEESFRFVRTRR
jgi:hypothetical protein